MNGPVSLAGVRQRPHDPVILAACATTSLEPRSLVVVVPLDGETETPYTAEVVFGPQAVLGGEGCAPAARVVGMAAAAGGAEATAYPAAPPLWLGCAGDRSDQAADYAAEAAGLLALVAEGGHGLRGFAGDVPALGSTVMLEDGTAATVTGIGYRDGRSREPSLRVRLASGEEARGPLPSDPGFPWRPAPAVPPETPAESGRGGRRGRRRRRGA